MKNFVIVRTGKGGQYAKRIASSIKWLNKHVKAFRNEKFRISILSVNDLVDSFEDGMFALDEENNTKPNNTIIYARAAYPSKESWMGTLIKLEERGFTVVNNTKALLLTSNKLECALFLQGKVNHPKTTHLVKGLFQDNENIDAVNDTGFFREGETYIAKPLTSINQGRDVVKFQYTDDIESLWDIIKNVPGDEIVLQEYVPYTALHRVIVIGGKALPYTFIDKPEWHKDGWKVSCCLNRETMRFKEDAPDELLELAEKTQKLIEGEINFIDIFENQYDDDCFTIGEINTACNLTIHENLAKKAGRQDWNIHYRIARYLVEKAMRG